MHISREELESLYINQNKTDREIASIYNTNSVNICSLRKKYGIKGITIEQRRVKENPLSEITARQKSIIFGSLLGDACLKTSRGCPNAILSISHSDKQREYIWWLYEELKTLCNNEPKEYISKGKYVTIEMKTRFRKDLGEIKNKIYIPKKTVSSWWLDQIDDLSLAIWFMDDGTLSYINKVKSIFSFATNSFSAEENYLLSSVLKSKFGIDSEVKPINRGNSLQYNLIISDNSFEKFNETVSPHIINCMKYKTIGKYHNIRSVENIEIDIEKEELENLYNTQKLTQVKIGEILGVHKSTISKYMNLFNIKPRSNEDAQVGEINEKDKNGKFVSKSITEEEEAKAKQIFQELRLSGFPLPIEKTREHYIGIIDSLCNADTCKKENNYFGYSRAGMDICSYYCPQIFSMAANGSKSPIEIFNDDYMLLDCIKRTIKYAKKDSISAVRQGLKTYRGNRCVTIFPPMWAKTILRETCLDKENLSVLDFSCGFAGRLLGSYSSGVVGSYTGIDPIKDNIHSHNKIGELIKEHSNMRNKIFHMKFINGCSENIIEGLEEKFDIIMTSPPYFSKEVYDNNSDQCYIKYPYYEVWKDGWLTKVIKDSYEKLNINGKIIIFASNYDKYRFGDDCGEVIKKVSGQEPIIYKFSIPSLEYFRSRDIKKTDTAFVVTKV